MTVDQLPAAPDEVALRELAIKQLKKKHDFRAHLLIYAMMNAFFVAIWAITNPGGFFWPIFIIVGWGIGVVMNAWDVYRGDGFDEAAVRAEMDRLARRTHDVAP
jgi:hypothetical protein